MSQLRSQIAQMLVMGFSGTDITPKSPVYRWVNGEHIGGVILFDKELADPTLPKNLVDPVQIGQLTNTLRTLSGTLPLLIALDYEGGEVDRLKTIPGCPKTLKPVEQAALEKTAMIEHMEIMAQTLKTLGFNLNFAPTLDLALNCDEGIIGKRGRSFSADPKQVIDVAAAFVRIFQEKGLLCCFKHFPGHGSATGDTHLGFVEVTETFDMKELEPYQVLLKTFQDAVMVMTAHVVNGRLDPSGAPATLSAPILTDLLRHQLGFDGVVISDDIQMRALSGQYSLEDVLTQTVNAGADMMIFGNQWDEHDASEVIDQMESLVRGGEISQTRIQEAYSRIMRLKSYLRMN